MAAKSKALGEEEGRAKSTSRAVSGPWPWIVAGLAALSFYPQGFGVAAQLLPCALVLVLEKTPGRPAARAVALCGLAAIWPSLELAWQVGLAHVDSAGMGLDTQRLATAWLAQGAGWLTAEGLAIATAITTERQVAGVVARLEKRRAELLAEWRNDTA